MNNKEWIDLLSKQFDVSRTTARDMLHSLCILKRYDNFKRRFNPHSNDKEGDMKNDFGKIREYAGFKECGADEEHNNGSGLLHRH